MKMPLIITDEDGNILYHSKKIKISLALEAYFAAVAKEKARGLVLVGGKNFYVKEVTAEGRRYLFFMDFDLLCNCFGASADRAAEGLFDISSFTKAKRIDMSLSVLLSMFMEAYSKLLSEEGVHLEVRGLDSHYVVNTLPNAAILCLAVMIRLNAENASYIKLGFVRECGRIRIYADTNGGKGRSLHGREFLMVLLRELSAAAGFTICDEVREGKRVMSLELTPLDISLLGLKAGGFEIYKKNFACYAEMF